MVSKDSFLKAFQSIFDETPHDEILMSTKFQKLDEWSSLIVLSLIVLFEDEFQTKLSPTDIEKAKTVENLYKLIEEKVIG